MRNIIVIVLILLLLVILIGCNGRRRTRVGTVPKDSLEMLLSKLEALGYYKFIEKTEIDRVKAESLKAGYIFGWEESARDYMSDAEDLAEGGIGEFLETIRPFLEKQNIELNVGNEDFSDKGYIIEINGFKYEIYSEDELNSEDLWELSTNRSFAIVNKLLTEANSNERIYILYGGNDLRAIFLTDEMYKLINNDQELSDGEKPHPVQASFE